MAHHESGREVVAHGEAAEHRLADDAERQQRAEPARGRGGTGRRNQASTPAATAASPTRPERMRLPYSITAWVSSGAHGLAVALGPVRAAQTGPGQAHGGAGEDDGREGRQGPSATR